MRHNIDDGLAVHEAASGHQALQWLEPGRLPETPAAMLLDLELSEMDGITLIGRLRELPAYKFTPILMLTTESQEDKKVAGKKAGATGWIIKPFDPARFIAVVKKVCPIGEPVLV